VVQAKAIIQQEGTKVDKTHEHYGGSVVVVVRAVDCDHAADCHVDETKDG